MPDVIKGKASCWPIQEELNDNPYYKAKGMLEFSKQNEQVSRIELIRKVDGGLWRLDFKDAVIRNKMKDVKDNELLDVLFHKMNKSF